jgi:hypothetical protein
MISETNVEIQNKPIEQQEYFATQNCPICGSSEKTALFKNLVHTCKVLKKAGVNIKNEDILSDVNLCRNCGHKYLSLIINEELINHYYAVVESEYYDTVKDNPRDRMLEDTERFARLIKDKCSDCSTVLEIGSGMGYLLGRLKEKGFECTGIEPSGFASNFSRNEMELNVITGLLDLNTFPNKKFDIIVLSDVVEHLYDVNAMFDLVKYYLSPNGRAVVLTGDSNSLYAKICGKKWLYFFSWEHISFFNKRSIRYLFNKHSLSLDYFRKTRHSDSFWQNWKVIYLTFRSMLGNFLGLRNHKFFYMAFDHLIAIGKNRK